jgi:hypothetical protein
MHNCNSTAEDSELKYDKHEMCLLACDPLLQVDGDVGDDNEGPCYLFLKDL